MEKANNNPKTYFKLFAGGILLYLIMVLPFLVYHDGIFFYYGDYNVQQVPFYILAHRAVRNGTFFWNSGIDLGSSMGGAFSFYLWGSPFFWLTILFPEKWIPYMLPVMMSLKCGTAMCTSYAWIRTQTKTSRAAVIGALLYTFSGFQACNIVFQHFHDATAFFPLYLLAFDRAVQKKKWTGFTLMTALMSVINYYFFFGQVIFIVIYYIVRYAVHQNLKKTGKQIIGLLLNGALGLLCVSFFLVQSLSGIMGNSRLDNHISGIDMLIYPDHQTPLAILKAMFMIPDLVARGTVFSSDNIRNGSLACYIPCFALSGVIAYFMEGKMKGARNWKKHLILVCLVMAFIPVLNSLFSALNDGYYARWFYMPLLVMVCMTGEVLERPDPKALRIGTLISSAITAGFLIYCAWPVSVNGRATWFGRSEYTYLLRTEFLGTVVQLAVLIWLVFVYEPYVNGSRRIRKTKEELPSVSIENNSMKKNSREEILIETSTDGDFAGEISLKKSSIEKNSLDESPAEEHSMEESSAGKAAVEMKGRKLGQNRKPGVTIVQLIMVIACCMITTMSVLFNGNSLIAYTGGVKWKQQMLDNVPELPGYDSFARIETDNTSTNYDMVWGIPTIHCFNSTVNPSIFSFYLQIGMRRTVESTLPMERVGARAMLSMKYYLENSLVTPEKTFEDKGGLIGYTFTNQSDGYKIYTNEHFIPMGFTYDHYITKDNYDALSKSGAADRMLVRDIILTQEQKEKYGDLLIEDTGAVTELLDDDTFLAACDARAATACTDFRFTNRGFEATADLPSENLVFFSVPYDKGFRAWVDGEEVTVECVDDGLMAIDVPAGQHSIVFTYLPYGLIPCVLISAGAACLIVILAVHRKKNEQRHGRSQIL